ncbi:LPS export ABC transporter permease LptG [Morganella morganii]|uniref:LPS export ABC transporter permease LptG n=1 Tax=Morganella morganii TaxID=582 RepID=UPI0023686C35|nr:LPS export ABC transporter permease LptG [Morganella morganii]
MFKVLVLDRYIGRTILQSIMMTLFMLVSLSGIIKFVDQLRRVGQGEYSTWDAGLYTIMSIPKDIQIFFPMAALLGALMGLGALATRSELVVMQASGYSRLQVAGSVMKTAIPLVILTMIVGEWLAPSGEQWARNYRAQKTNGASLLATNRGMWAKDGSDFIYIQRVDSETQLKGITLYRMNDDHKLKSILSAAAADYNSDSGTWTLSQVQESVLKDIYVITGEQKLSMTWQTQMTPEKLSVAALDPEALSISGLYQYVDYLQQSGQDAGRYQLNLWKKVFAPLSVAVMMLMALSFIFGPLRSVAMGVRVVTGIACGFVFYVSNEIFGSLSLTYKFPPLLGALLPSLLFLAISVYMLVKRK